MLYRNLNCCIWHLGNRIVAMYYRSLPFPTLRLANCVHRTRSASVPDPLGDFIPKPLTEGRCPSDSLPRFAAAESNLTSTCPSMYNNLN